MREIAFDTESHLFAPGRLAPPVVCMTYCEQVGLPKIVVGDDIVRLFHTWIVDPDVYLIGHNVAFDLGVLVQKDPSLMQLVFDALDAGRIGCTMLREQLRCIAAGNGRFDPAGGATRYTLAACVMRHLGETVEGKAGPDVWRLRYHELDGVELESWPQEALSYALGDAENTLRVWNAQKLDDTGYSILPSQVRAAWGLHLMSCWGVRTDPSRVRALAAKIEKHLHGAMNGMTEAQIADLELPKDLHDVARAGLIKLGIYRPVGSQNKAAVQAMVEAAYNDNPPMTQPKNPDTAPQTSTAREYLEESGDPRLEFLATIGEIQNVRSSYLPQLVRGTTEVINPRYTVIKETCRTSSSGPSIQKVPRLGGVRDAFRARDGWLYIGSDYHVAEMCSLAQVLVETFGSSAMADAINDGRELHLETAAGILGWSYDRTMTEYKAGNKMAKRARQLAKVANFGFPGGMSAKTMVPYAKGYGVIITPQEAIELHEAWLNRYPEMAMYFEAISEMVDAGGGRFTYHCPVTEFVRGGVGYTEGCNHPFQLRVAVATKRATYRAVKLSYIGDGPLRGCRPWGMIHDELIVSAPRAKAVAAAPRLAEVMTEELQALCPDVRVSADGHIMEHWYKDAEPVFLNGKLAIWTPSGPVAV